MFYNNFKKLCEMKKLTAYKVCAEIGIDRSSVTKWKNGTAPTSRSLDKIEKYFHVPVSVLVGSQEALDEFIEKNKPQEDVLILHRGGKGRRVKLSNEQWIAIEQILKVMPCESEDEW